jgi:hypothetical protein
MAKHLLEDLQKLDAAADPTSVFTSLKQEYGNRLKLVGCDSQECYYTLTVGNWNLARFHLAPQTHIRVSFILLRGSVSLVQLEYTSALFKENSPVVNFQEVFCARGSVPPCDEFYLDPHGRDVVPVWNGMVEIGQMATQRQKSAALALNLDCLAAFSGCKDISELLPSLWKRTSPGAVSSRMRSMADSIQDGLQPLPD